jgi:lysophospholipase L1-like esterase
MACGLTVAAVPPASAAPPASAPAATAATGLPTDPNIRYFGRWDTSSATGYVPEWAGAYSVVGFTGRTVELRQRGSVDLYASIDGGAFRSYVNVSGVVNLTPSPLASATHTLRVSYRPVEGSYHGDDVFQGVVLASGAYTVAPVVPSKVIEFIGDSITVGYRSSQEALTAYGWLTAEQLGAGHTEIARSGACLYPSNGCIGMRDRWLRTGVSATSPMWNFSRYQANAAVINLGTNDLGHRVTSAQFESAYVTLLHEIRAKYPVATIFAMETFGRWFASETKAAAASVTAAGDSRVRYVDTEGWINPSTDTVDGTHPTDAGHRKIAARLAPIVASALR